MAILPREFYSGDTVQTAQDLLGKYLVRILDGVPLACRIVETEAYVGRCDKACHAYQYHRSNRTAVMFGAPGHAYIYLIYGMYHCLNLVTEPEGEPSAVLIRGGTAAAGEALIHRLRFGDTSQHLNAYQRKNILNGPGKLCKGLALTKAQNGLDLTGNTLFVCTSLTDLGLPDPTVPAREQILSGPRIGVDYAEEAKDFPWNFRLAEQ